MANKHFEAVRSFLVLLFLVCTLGCSPSAVTPEMTEVIDSFTDRAKCSVVLHKYDAQSLVPQELTICDMAKPVVTKIEEKDGITFYTMEARVEKCESSPAAVGTVRIFVMGWKNGKIAKFVWGGPKGGKVEY
jgi:hypothetical protein